MFGHDAAVDLGQLAVVLFFAVLFQRFGAHGGRVGALFQLRQRAHSGGQRGRIAGGKAQAVTPGRTIAPTLPRSLANTGVPIAWASAGTRAKLS